MCPFGITYQSIAEVFFPLLRYDRLAYRYVSYVTGPLLVGYTIYSLKYQTHKGWYSFIISTLTSFVYTFGFVRLIFFPPCHRLR